MICRQKYSVHATQIEVISCLCCSIHYTRHVCMYVPLLKSYYSSHCYLEMVSTRLHENHETAQILSQSLSLGAKLNWLLLFMHKFIALQPNYNNVTWTNNFNSDDKSVRRILHALSLSVVTTYSGQAALGQIIYYFCCVSIV